MQTYSQYLKTMQAYCFCALSFDLWASWQVFYHGYYLTSDV